MLKRNPLANTKRYFMYEVKKNILPALVITALCTILYMAIIIPGNYSPNPYVSYYLPTSPIFMPQILLMILCTVVPILMFSFKMSARQTDLYYAMPIKREKIYLIKAIIGLGLVLIPYTLSYWYGFAVMLAKINAYDLFYYLPLYLWSLPLATLLFGIVAFIFTRANRVVDGVLFVALYVCVMVPTMSYIINYANEVAFTRGLERPFGWGDFSFWFLYSPLTWLSTLHDGLLRGLPQSYDWDWLMYTVHVLMGLGAWFGLLFSVRYEKPENAEHISDSKFGYVVLIPIYVASLIALLQGGTDTIIFAACTLVAAIIGYIIFRRSIKLKPADWISLGGAAVLGFILAIL